EERSHLSTEVPRLPFRPRKSGLPDLRTIVYETRASPGFVAGRVASEASRVGGLHLLLARVCPPPPPPPPPSLRPRGEGNGSAVHAGRGSAGAVPAIAPLRAPRHFISWCQEPPSRISRWPNRLMARPVRRAERRRRRRRAPRSTPSSTRCAGSRRAPRRGAAASSSRSTPP